MLSLVCFFFSVRPECGLIVLGKCHLSPSQKCVFPMCVRSSGVKMSRRSVVPFAAVSPACRWQYLAVNISVGAFQFRFLTTRHSVGHRHTFVLQPVASCPMVERAGRVSNLSMQVAIKPEERIVRPALILPNKMLFIPHENVMTIAAGNSVLRLMKGGAQCLALCSLCRGANCKGL